MHPAAAGTAAKASAEEWERRYASVDRAWSGRPNAVLVDLVSDLTPGRAVDLGCGEGSDVLWLARCGWEVDGVDFSRTAVQRGREAAQAAGVAQSVRFHAEDLMRWAPGYEGGADLVMAMFLQSYDGQDREALLRSAARMVAAGGRLLVISHATPPPWSSNARRADLESLLVTPEGDRGIVDPDGRWHVEVSEIRTRSAVGPDGRAGELEDSVLLVRRG